MSTKKSKSAKPTAPAAEQPVPVEAPAAAEVATPPEHTAALATIQPSAPTKARRGKSTIQSPVAFVWANSHNLCSAAINAGQPLPSRKVLVDSAINQGIAYYTARTQVQAYLKASGGGTRAPAKLPKGLTIN